MSEPTLPIKNLATSFDIAFLYVAKFTNVLDFESGFNYEKEENRCKGMCWTPKEFAALKKLASLISRNGGNLEENWKLFLKMTIELNNSFVLSNFTPSIILSQYNNILLKLHQKQNAAITPNSFLESVNCYKLPDGYAQPGV